MLHEEVFQRLAAKHPEAIMVRATLEQALPATFVDEVFKRVACKQYTRKLLFSTLVRLLSMVVCRVRPSVHAAFQALEGELNVIAKTVYKKLNGAETTVAEALVGESSQRMAAVVDELHAPLPPLIPGYRTRILDGNHLASTEHRLQVLRSVGGGALPGLALVVYDAERGLVDRVYLCEDGHAQERELLVELLGDIGAGQLWIADRNFATTVLMHQVHASGSRFLVRRHKRNGRLRETSDWRPVAGGETGEIDERRAMCDDDFGNALPVRLVRVRLKKPTRDGDREIELVTDLPDEVSAPVIAEAYRQRWQIETAFAELDRVFEGEIESLGHPRAALLAFALALIAFNTLGVVKAALRKQHGCDRIQQELSAYFLGENVQRAEAALELFLDDRQWEARYAALSPAALAAQLRDLASQVNLQKLRKHPRGPKKPPPKRITSANQPHVSTARLLAQRKSSKMTR